MTVTLEDGSSAYEEESEDNFILIGNPGCINQGTRNIKDTVIRYGDFALDQYDYRFSDAINHIDSKYYSLIGRVLVSFSELEDMLDRMIMYTANPSGDADGLRLVNMFTFIQKLNYVTGTMMPFIDDRKKKTLRSLSKDIEACIEMRNLVAHAKWETLTYDGFVRCQTRTDKDGYMYFRYFEFTDDIFQGIIESVDEVIMSVIDFIRSDDILLDALREVVEIYEDDE